MRVPVVFRAGSHIALSRLGLGFAAGCHLKGRRTPVDETCHATPSHDLSLFGGKKKSRKLTAAVQSSSRRLQESGEEARECMTFMGLRTQFRESVMQRRTTLKQPERLSTAAWKDCRIFHDPLIRRGARWAGKTKPEWWGNMTRCYPLQRSQGGADWSNSRVGTRAERGVHLLRVEHKPAMSRIRMRRRSSDRCFRRGPQVDGGVNLMRKQQRFTRAHTHQQKMKGEFVAPKGPSISAV